MVNSQRVQAELWRKENAKWLLPIETNDVNESVELKRMENSFQLKDFYFKALEMLEQQKLQ